jgi:simple sugar transport system permease protein
MSDYLNTDFLVAILQTATPLVLAAMGGLLSERSGVMNIALEGFIIVGAFTAVLGTYYTDNPWIGLLCGLVAASFAGLIHAFWCITLRGDQVVAGTALNLLGAGIPAFMIQRIWGRAGQSDSVQTLPRFWHGLSVLVPAALVIVVLVQILLFKTKPGLRIVASGEHPRAAECVGIPVSHYRYGWVVASGTLAGLAGAYLSIGELSFFTRDMSQGRGFIALAAVIFGGWNPIGATGAALLFAFAQAFQIRAQAAGLPVSRDLLLALPYLLTLVAIAGVVGRTRAPAGLGQHATGD